MKTLSDNPEPSVPMTTLTCTATRKNIRERAVDLALSHGRAAADVSKADWVQARSELTGDPGGTVRTGAIDTVAESSRRDPVPRTPPQADERMSRLLGHLDAGFRSDSARLRDLDREFKETLASARQFGNQPNAADRWNAHWHRDWDRVETILRAKALLVDEMDRAIMSADEERLQTALTAGNAIQAEDAALAQALGAIREQAGILDAEDRAEWNILARTLKSHVDTIHSCAQALRIKLELLKAHSRKEANDLARGVQGSVSDSDHASAQTPETDAVDYQQKYHEAARELQQERHMFLGFMDVVKGLFMWVESTDERARYNLSLELHPA